MLTMSECLACKFRSISRLRWPNRSTWSLKYKLSTDKKKPFRRGAGARSPTKNLLLSALDPFNIPFLSEVKKCAFLPSLALTRHGNSGQGIDDGREEGEVELAAEMEGLLEREEAAGEQEGHVEDRQRRQQLVEQARLWGKEERSR